MSDTSFKPRSEFFPWLSHKVRQPINAVMEVIALLRAKEFPPDQMRYLEAVHDSAQDLLMLVNDLLDLTRIEEGNFRLGNARFDLRAAVQGTADQLAREARHGGFDFQCLIHPEVPTWVLGDVGRLRQVLANLGRVSIGQTRAGAVLMDVGVDRESETEVHLRFAVNDTGRALPAGLMESIFHPDLEATPEALRGSPELYVKIFLSRRLIELHGGELGIDSDGDPGSTYWFSLSLKKALPRSSADEGREPGEDKAMPLEGTRVLLVDDNEDDQIPMEGALRSWGAYVESVVGGDQGFLRLRHAGLDENPFHIVLISSWLRGQEGENLGRAIKSDPLLKELRLVLLTPVGHRGDAARLEQIGFSAYLVKPVDDDHLRRCLVSILSEGEPTDGAEGIITRHWLVEEVRRKRGVLIIDGHEIHRMALERILGKLGYRTRLADDQDTAEEALKEEKIAVVFLDLPEKEALLSALTHKSADATGKDAGPVVVGIYDRLPDSSQKRYRDSGLTYLLQKPVEEEALKEVLAKIENRG